MFQNRLAASLFYQKCIFQTFFSSNAHDRPIHLNKFNFQVSKWLYLMIPLWLKSAKLSFLQIQYHWKQFLFSFLNIYHHIHKRDNHIKVPVWVAEPDTLPIQAIGKLPIQFNRHQIKSILRVSQLIFAIHFETV